MAIAEVEKGIKDAMGEDAKNVDQVATTRGKGFDPVLKGADFFTGPKAKSTPEQDAQFKAIMEFKAILAKRDGKR